MSKITHIKVLGLALFAVFALSMVASATAFAEDEWLFNGGTFAGELETNTEGALELLILASGTLVNTIDCSALFLGDVTGGAGGINLVLDVFTLTPGQVLIEELPGTSLTCETLQGVAGLCEVGATKESLLWVDELSLALGLTWETLIVLDGAVFLDRFHHVAFELSCITAAGKLEALCEGATSGKLVNVAGGVLIELSEAAGIESEALTCLDGTEEFLVEIDADLIIKHANGGTLSVS